MESKVQNPKSKIVLRVLHVINGEDYSGAERVQDLLAMRLPEHGFEASFACLKPDRFAACRQSKRAPLYELPMRHHFDLSPVARLARLIRREGYVLVHTHSARNALIGRPAAALAGVPMIHHMHCQTSTEVRRRWLSRLTMRIERLSLRSVDGVIAVSESSRRYLLRSGYAERKLWLVHNGVPSHPIEETSHPAAEERRTPRQACTLGMVAMFRPRKGLEVLIDALAVLRGGGLPVRLRAVGRFQTPRFEREIQRRVARLRLEGAIEWVGFRRDVRAELARMDVFVLPSLVAEAMPMSVLEAMAAGVPVVGSRVDGITDLVRDEIDGLLAPPGDAGALAIAIGRLAGDEAARASFVAIARRRQIELYSDHRMAAGVAEVYRAVLACREAVTSRPLSGAEIS